MPYQDGSGPQGQGPGTGRGLGPCSAGQARQRGRDLRTMPNNRRFNQDDRLDRIEQELTEIKNSLADR